MRYLTLFFLPLLFLACQQEAETTEPDYAVLAGRITNLTGPVMVFPSAADYRMLELAADSTFSDTVYLSTPKTVSMRVGGAGFSFYVDQGDVINLTYDANEDADQAVISGHDEKITAFMLAENAAAIDEANNFELIFSRSEEAYLAFSDSLKREELARIKAADLPEGYRAYATKGAEIAHVSRLKQYPTYHGYATENEAFVASEDYLEKIPALDYDNDALAQQYTAYQGMVMDELQDAYYGIEDSTMSEVRKVLTVMEKKKSPALRALWLEISLMDFGTGTPDLMSSKDEIMAAIEDPHVRRKYEEKFAKLEKLMPGQPSPSFTLMNHAGGTTSLEDLRGKFVYIDVWATWCGPCIQEIPSLKEVEESFHGKNIAFVSVSIDDLEDEEKWRSFVDKRELGGIQLMGDKAWSTDFVLDYEINGIPRFILLDTEGKIISADAPRPSEEKLREQLAGLLAK